jgi:hypothetical protein
MTSTMLRMIAVQSRAWHWARPSFQGDHESRHDPQHVRLAADFEEFPQLRAAAVYLVSADEIEAGPVGMAAGAEPELGVPAQPYALARWPTTQRRRPGQQW